MDRTHVHSHPVVVEAQRQAVLARLRLLATLAAPVLVLAVLAPLVVTGLIARPATSFLVLIALAALAGWLAAARAARRHERFVAGVWMDFRSMVVDVADPLLVDAHKLAVEIVEDNRRHNGGFVLFLRSFEPEAAGWLTPEAAGRERKIVTPFNPVPSELATEVARIFGSRPILGIANPFAFIGPDEDGVAARLQLPNEGWLDVLRSLISGAHAIVVDLVLVAPGVQAELAEIAAAGREQDTLVVIPPSSAAVLEHVEFMRELVQVTGAVPPEAKIPSRDEPELVPFPHVVKWDSTMGDKPLRGFLDPRLCSLDARNAWAANHHAAELIREGRHPDALPILERALELAVAGGDVVIQAVTHGNLGVVYADGLADRKRAIAAHEQSLALYRSAGDEQGAREAARNLAVLHMEAGDDDEAVRFLLR